MFKKLKNWEGSRKELISKIIEIENEDKSKFVMISNKTGKGIPINSRRIQQYLDIGILPRGKLIKGEYYYRYEHIIRYLAAIILKNKGHSLLQIESILSYHEYEELIEIFLINNDLKTKKLKKEFSTSDTSKSLRELGREEGRVLRSQWIKFAVTKWCHLDIRKKELIKLNKKEINLLSNVIVDTLEKFQKKDIDSLIK